MKLKIVFLLGMVVAAVTLHAQPGTAEPKTKWFTDARFGMFIHWGLYSAAEGMWKGERLRYSNNYAEWIRYRNRISKEEYGTLAKRFDWSRINPEEWVLLAKKAGMKYITITSKHHDGVALWNSKVSDYNLTKLSGTNRDVIKELAAACKKHGIKLGFYYSHWVDWDHPYGWDHNKELTGIRDEDYNKYWQEKVIPQLRELLTNYGDIAMFWFDMWMGYDKTVVKKEQLDQVVRLIRTLQPNCLINSRIGLPASDPGVDFESKGDNEFGSVYTAHPWETSGTIAHSWGYYGQENEWKSTSQLLQSLIGNVSLNGDFTLNIGPRADGSVPYEGVRRLEDMGRWLSRNGEAIYGCTGLELRAGQHDWGRITTKTVKNKQLVYLHVYNWPLDKVLRVSGILSRPEKAELITASGKRPLRFTQNGPLTHIQLPAAAADPFVSVVVLQYPEPVTLDGEMVPESTFGGFALTATNVWEHPPGFKLARYDGLRPTRLVVDREGTLAWEVYIPQAGNYQVDLSYHNHSKESVGIEVLVSGQHLEQQLKPSGTVVAEPHSSYTDEFADTRLGQLHFPKAGFYQVSFKTASGTMGPLYFNRIWISNTAQ
ncbi:alpha-L-fucosidase [Niabella drilacis]|uniref:alpha-L-fucosidase n=1 Tax=Niabella drilacis (strain DSM 25811 / CCM 8410 / CCUG 62505 / LMG 26954 / E90) TaxID=1285928 RepID=A0A1G6LAZ9_NIADE|nr:alpha-L-fucosidase [Niabella drilacis]SDC39766.1 alpha-L-fucosidase [Niabella drilacis]